MNKEEAVYPTVSPPAPIHPREEERIARLLGYDILDSGEDPLLDRLTKLAAEITGSPISLISLIDDKRQWIKSHYGTEIRETSREDSFCRHTILEPKEGELIVNDALTDKRFINNKYVTGEPHIRFYAGIPLDAGDGLAIGSLCVIDQKPNSLSQEQIKSLHSLASIVMDYITIHRSNRELTTLLMREKEVYSNLLRTSSKMAIEAPTFDDALHSLIEHLDPKLGYLSCRIRNMQTGGTTGIIYNPLLPKDPELPLLWVQLDSAPQHPTGDAATTEFISTASLRPEFSYLVVPVRIRDRLVAVIELIYPDHRKMDPRIREVFNIMATNLGIVAERELVNLELQRKATHDGLTGAANRNVFMAQLERTIGAVDPAYPSSALLFVDLDGFKEVNDNFGHQVGDRLLIEVTQRLKGICRGEDLMGRLSGDEFVLIALGIADQKALEQLLERIHRHLAMPILLGELEIKIGSSIGCCMLDSNEISTSEIIRRAEEAMYLVKTGKRKHYCIADDQLIKEFKAKHEMDRMIRDSIKEKRMFLALQPIVDSTTGAVASAEALFRILDKEGKVLAAECFMESLDRLRILTEIDEWVFAETIRIMQAHLREFSAIPGFRISINISPAILITHGYAKVCLARLEDAAIPTSMFRLEIVETHLQTNNRWLLENLKTFRDAGVHIAIDDFGTGYSNLQYLTALPINTIKIDKSFLKGIIPGDKHSNDLLKAIIGIGKIFNYTIIAEGVEQESESKHLASLGCTLLQGYLYGKPEKVDVFLKNLNSQVHPSEHQAVTKE
jgi:diguanylate cyclase (GGDEF)-like protein